MNRRWKGYDLGAEVDMNRLLNAVLQNVWIVVVSAIISAAIALLGMKYLVTPLYRTEVKLFVNNGDSFGADGVRSFSSDNLRAVEKLLDTYFVLLRSRTTLEDVIEYAKIADDAEEVRNQLSMEIAETMGIERIGKTAVFRVIIKRGDPEEAERIANAIAVVFPRRVSEIINKTSARVVDVAVVPRSPVTPNLKNSLVLGGMFGVFGGIAFIVFREIFDDRIRSSLELEQYDGIALLAVIPDLYEKRTRPIQTRLRKRKFSYGMESENGNSESAPHG